MSSIYFINVQLMMKYIITYLCYHIFVCNNIYMYKITYLWWNILFYMIKYYHILSQTVITEYSIFIHESNNIVIVHITRWSYKKFLFFHVDNYIIYNNYHISIPRTVLYNWDFKAHCSKSWLKIIFLHS